MNELMNEIIFGIPVNTGKRKSWQKSALELSKRVQKKNERERKARIAQMIRNGEL